MRSGERRLINESPEMHLSAPMQAYITREVNRPCKQWIHEVLMCRRETDRVKLRTPDFVLLPDIYCAIKRSKQRDVEGNGVYGIYLPMNEENCHDTDKCGTDNYRSHDEDANDPRTRREYVSNFGTDTSSTGLGSMGSCITPHIASSGIRHVEFDTKSTNLADKPSAQMMLETYEVEAVSSNDSIRKRDTVVIVDKVQKVNPQESNEDSFLEVDAQNAADTNEMTETVGALNFNMVNSVNTVSLSNAMNAADIATVSAVNRVNAVAVNAVNTLNTINTAKEVDEVDPVKTVKTNHTLHKMDTFGMNEQDRESYFNERRGLLYTPGIIKSLGASKAYSDTPRIEGSWSVWNPASPEFIPSPARSSHQRDELDRRQWKIKRVNQTSLYAPCFHWLAVATDTRLRTLRDLRGCHIPILQSLYSMACQKIQEELGVEPGQIMSYIHYPPSVYQLHVHFRNVTGPGAGAFQDTLRIHSLTTIINNLQIDPEYYSKSNLQLPVYVHTDLFLALGQEPAGKEKTVLNLSKPSKVQTPYFKILRQG